MFMLSFLGNPIDEGRACAARKKHKLGRIGGKKNDQLIKALVPFCLFREPWDFTIRWFYNQVISRWFYNNLCLFSEGSGQIIDTAKKEESRKRWRKTGCFQIPKWEFCIVHLTWWNYSYLKTKFWAPKLGPANFGRENGNFKGNRGWWNIIYSLTLLFREGDFFTDSKKLGFITIWEKKYPFGGEYGAWIFGTQAPKKQIQVEWVKGLEPSEFRGFYWLETDHLTQPTEPTTHDPTPSSCQGSSFKGEEKQSDFRKDLNDTVGSFSMFPEYWWRSRGIFHVLLPSIPCFSAQPLVENPSGFTNVTLGAI